MGIKILLLIFDSGIIKLQEGVTVAIWAAGPGAEAADWSEAAVVPMNVEMVAASLGRAGTRQPPTHCS